jgi:hypothetical protein
MSAGVGPHKASEPGYIVAWHSKRQFRAGKQLDKIMTFGEAQERARALSERNKDLTFWAEHAPQKFEPH